jgi:hypothetical protein
MEPPGELSAKPRRLSSPRRRRCDPTRQGPAHTLAAPRRTRHAARRRRPLPSRARDASREALSRVGRARLARRGGISFRERGSVRRRAPGSATGRVRRGARPAPLLSRAPACRGCAGGATRRVRLRGRGLVAAANRVPLRELHRFARRRSCTAIRGRSATCHLVGPRARSTRVARNRIQRARTPSTASSVGLLAFGTETLAPSKVPSVVPTPWM